MSNTNQNAPDFTPEQEAAILRAAGHKVAKSICHVDDSISSDELLGAGELPVYGAFVSLKRFRQLRACCGWLGESLELREALDNAAYRAAVDDLRFAPIQPFEINEMEMDVWALYGLELVAAQGEERVNFVEIGTHGLLIVRGEHRGLLLPSVAKELGVDARGFLEHTCRKASLPVNAWKDEQTMLFRFRGKMLHKNLKDTLSPEVAELVLVPPQGPTTKDLVKLADHCYRNIRKQYHRTTPDFYLPGAYDGPIAGACLRIRLNQMTADCAQLHLAAPQPLQATLLQLSENAALAMRQNGISPDVPFKTSLCIFWNSQPIGSADSVKVENLDTRVSGLLAQRFGRWTLAYAPGKNPEAILSDVLEHSQFAVDKDTQIFTVNVACSEIAFITSTVQKPYIKPDPRMPIVAGQFYPGTPEEVNRVLDILLPPDGSATAEKKSYAGAVVPHAGWSYSAPLAVDTLRRMEFSNRVLVFSPKHHGNGVDWAVAPTARWELPARSMEGDINMSRALVEAVPQFQLDAMAHEREHSIEVILPFLARLCPGSHIIGACMAGSDALVPEAAKRLADWISTLPYRPTLIASSDMNHYASDEVTRQRDALAIQAMLNRDPEGLLEVVRGQNISMCGVLPVVLMMMTLRQLGSLNEATQVGYATSGDVSKDKRSVVGYCGMLFR